MGFEVHVLASGSDGNCSVLVNEDRAVMIDCGISYKRAKELMDLSGVDESMIEGILITHEHTDHTCGAKRTSKMLGVPVFCNRGTYTGTKELADVNYKEIKNMKTFQIAGVDVIPLPTSHDTRDPCCFFFTIGDKKYLSVTDTGKLLFPVENALKECDLALIESNYDPTMLMNNRIYPEQTKARIFSDLGHMSNEYCGTMIKKTQTDKKRKFFLAHLSQNNNTPDLAKDTVSEITGIRRSMLDCLEIPDVKNDTRILRL